MDTCSICGAAHAPAAEGEPCFAGCVRSLAARVAAMEPPKPLVYSVEATAGDTTIVSLGGSAGGSGALK